MLISNSPSKKGILPLRVKLWEFTFVILFMYTFFYQNAIGNVSGLLILLCGVLACFFVLELLIDSNTNIENYLMIGLSAFVLVSLLVSLAYSNNVDDSIAAGLRMIEYLIMGFSLCKFLLCYPERLNAIFRYIWFSITALCAFVFFGGVQVTDAGGVGLEGLNVNLLSSFIAIQIFAAFLLLVQANKIGKMIYIISIVVVLFIQVLTASRRGFLVACAFVLLAVFFCIIPRYTTKRSVKRTIWIAVIMITLAVVFVKVGDYILNETALGARLLGEFNSGDALRVKYQEIAMQQFSKQPIFGVGLNGLQSVMGVYSHSLYYEVLSCTGILGTLILFGTLLSIGKRLYKNAKNRREQEADWTYISKLSLCFFVALMVSGIAVTMIYEFFFYICLAILIAIALLQKNRENKTR